MKKAGWAIFAILFVASFCPGCEFWDGGGVEGTSDADSDIDTDTDIDTDIDSDTDVDTDTEENSGITLTEQFLITGSIGPVYSITWSPDGGMLATAGFLQVNLWNSNEGTDITTLTGHESFVWGVAWSPDGDYIASACQDGTTRLWNFDSQEEESVLDTGWAFCVDWSDDGSRFVTGNSSDEVQVWDFETNDLVLTHSIGATSYDANIISVDWSSNWKKIAAGYWSGTIVIFDSITGDELELFEDYTQARCDVNGIAWSPDGETLASAHQDGKIRLWDVENSELAKELSGHIGWARGIAWSPDGKMIASTGEDTTVRLWDPESGQLLTTNNDHSTPVWSVAWSKDGLRLATGSGYYNSQVAGGNSIFIWSVETEVD